MDQLAGNVRQQFSDGNADHASGYGKDDRFQQKLQLDHAWFCSQCFTKTDFFRAFRDGHKHHVHDADSADQKSNAGNAAKHRGHHRDHRIHRAEQAFHIEDIERILVLIEGIVQ